MTRVLVVWEDHYYQTLGPFVKKRLTARAPSGQARFPELSFHTSHGNGSFQRYASSTWENVRAKGLPGNPGAIDHLLCVVDGDKLHERIPSIARPPAGDLSSWITSAERAWETHLRSLCVTAPPSTVHGGVLRWSKESLVLAGYDRASFARILGIDAQSSPVAEHLSRCSPIPSRVEAASFSNTFRAPLRCLGDLDSAQRSPRPGVLSKNAPELDDVLRALARDDCASIAERVPDIDRLADSIWRLVTDPSEPVSPPAPARRGAEKKRRA